MGDQRNPATPGPGVIDVRLDLSRGSVDQHPGERCRRGRADINRHPRLDAALQWLGHFLGEEQTLDDAAVDEMLADDLVDVLLVHVGVPGLLGIDDDHGAL